MTQVYTHARMCAHTHTGSTLTWEMLTPVSLSTLSGKRLRMSSTSPVTLAAPTVPFPLDTSVILLAEVRGPLISSATWWVEIAQTTAPIKLAQLLTGTPHSGHWLTAGTPSHLLHLTPLPESHPPPDLGQLL